MRRRRLCEEEGMKDRLLQLAEENTYGGNKSGIPARRQMPIVSSNQGIKMIWDNRADEYPSMIRLRMTDDRWVEYRIAYNQPGPAGGKGRSGTWEQGYPPKRR